ncbi:GntR family transcriptional regulator/MocR family aminotransferase [Anaerosolibacter carboniphilus]|uniref:GntR family transcriptional regulator/MocR family aminotransferase n=1 Tax=Anaerosolibacter carboniphilus TaxID=1417629 RepID=A0A841KYA1_9FIRM|nr:PLP-dependent aminotransferase family protein [Anaerosolibacter carboniphilus]MBB6218337.1 GntR family transcriptional regulator/MocR family aminotransferase [Anaerosolibacter carboniphilus]
MIILKNDVRTPLYIQIYEQLKEEIITGALPDGSKLPSTRHLAEMLAVGRNTVENAYLQLASEGYVESRIGSGFFVQNIHDMMRLANEEKHHELPIIVSSTEKNNMHKIYPYNFEYGHLSSQDFPLNIWRKVSTKALASLTADDMTMYCDRKGELQLRKDLADYLRRSRGVSCDPEQIILCSGFEYAISLLSQLLQKTFDQIALEDPGYSGARDIFKNNGLKVVPVGIEKDGVNVKELEKSFAKMVYVTPSHQFPSGVVMPIQKRLLLLDWARQNNGVIIEDDYDSELRYNSRPIPSISSVARNEDVIYIGTMSKALSPSLRISYMVLPQKWMTRYDEEFKMYQSPVSLLQQRILQEYIHSGHWERHLRKVCIANKKKHDLLIRTIQELMGNKVIIHGKNAGLHILLESTQGLKEKEMIEKAREHGVLVYPVSMFWIDKSRYPDNMVLLGFGNVSENDIVEGIKQLAQAWENTV